jgi:small GTP-binding protein
MSLPTNRMKIKICLVGDAAVGKTSLIQRFVHDRFSGEYQATMGAKVQAKDVLAKSVGGKGVAVRMTIWDIIGESTLLQELGPSYFFGTQGILAVCDLTRFSTYENLPIWLSSVRRTAGDVPMALAVNKTDLKGEVMVLYDEYQVQQFADAIGARWYMTSAKTGENVEGLFTALATDIIARMTPQKDELLA